MEIFKSKVSSLKESKKIINAKLSKFQQNDLLKLTAAIQEPSANIYQFKFEYTNKLFQKFENSFVNKDDNAVMKSQL